MSNGDVPPTSDDTPRYLDELVRDMRQLNQLQMSHPGGFRHAQMLLTAEIDRVWNLIYSTRGLELGDSGSPRSNKSTDSDLGPVTMQEKIPIPNYPRCNFIGRILGPCGISVKQLESETNCRILIRGEGSVKDPVRESRLRGQSGWEHLSEPLHVLVTATDSTREKCDAKLCSAVETVSRLLTPQHDDYKRRQLVQLAIINGTYRHDA